GAKPEGFRIVDSNSIMLAVLVQRDGGQTLVPPILRDDPELIRQMLDEQRGADVVLISGGSSVGQEDHAPRVVAEMGELPVHGVALRPASPAGIGFVGGKPVFLLPGNPVSCLCAYDLFASRAVRRLGGRSPELPYTRAELPLGAKVSSAVGRVDYVRVRVAGGKAEPLAVSGASLLSTTTAADVAAPLDVPSFDRSNVDGFAVQAADTFGASEDRPRLLRLNPETLATGAEPRETVLPGTATAIATGAMLPRGADAVVMIEFT